MIGFAEPKLVNILLLIDVLDGTDGGTEQHLLFLLDKLPRDRFRVHFAVLDRVQYCDPASLPVEPIIVDGHSLIRLGSVKHVRKLAALIKELGIDVVHTFFQTSELAAILATRLARRGTVLGSRRNLGYWHTRSTLWLARIMRLAGAEYAANCQAAKEAAVAMEWLSEDRVTVIQNAMLRERREEGFRNVLAPELLGIQDGEQVVGTVGTVRPVKDHATFLRAARLVLDRHPRTRFLIVGRNDAEHFTDLQSLVGSLGIGEQVSWLGPIANPYSVLPHCDLAVSSSLSEALSNAIVEYAAAGVATIATDVGGSREVVEPDHTGFIVPPGRPELLAERIRQLLLDDDLRRRFGDNARRKAESEFSEERILDEHAKLYERLAQRPNVRKRGQAPSANAPTTSEPGSRRSQSPFSDSRLNLNTRH